MFANSRYNSGDVYVVYVDSSICSIGNDSSLGSETRIRMKLALIEVVERWETPCRVGGSRRPESSNHNH